MTAVALCASFILLVPPTPAMAHNSWDRWHWTRGTLEKETVIQVIRQNLEYGYGLPAVLTDWSRASGVRLEFASKCSGLLSVRCIWVHDGGYDIGEICPTKWFGCPQPIEVTWSDHFVRMVVHFNTATTTNFTARQRRSLACHEFGHALGLAHTDRPTSCMITHGGWPLRGDSHDLSHLANRYRHSHLLGGIDLLRPTGLLGELVGLDL